MQLPNFTTLRVNVHKNYILIIRFNRPSKFKQVFQLIEIIETWRLHSALSPETYDDWLSALEYAKIASNIKVIVLTGNGKLFTAGQELTAPKLNPGETLRDYFVRRVQVTKKLIDTIITLPKLLIYAINGNTIVNVRWYLLIMIN